LAIYPEFLRRYLQRALLINPNHLKASLLLGRVLLEDGRVAEAVATLEEAHRYDEGAARSDLVRALLAMADGQAEAEQLATYERILQIDQHQPIAGKRRRAIWINRGEVAQRQGDLEAAVAAFQEAGDRERVEKVKELNRKRELEAKVKEAEENEARGKWEAAISTYEAGRRPSAFMHLCYRNRPMKRDTKHEWKMFGHRQSWPNATTRLSAH
jgi:tetratricopeptide (TPR) repeat protein